MQAGSELSAGLGRRFLLLVLPIFKTEKGDKMLDSVATESAEGNTCWTEMIPMQHEVHAGGTHGHEA